MDLQEIEYYLGITTVEQAVEILRYYIPERLVQSKVVYSLEELGLY